jgi:hypothetical protein
VQDSDVGCFVFEDLAVANEASSSSIAYVKQLGEGWPQCHVLLATAAPQAPAVSSASMCAFDSRPCTAATLSIQQGLAAASKAS